MPDGRWEWYGDHAIRIVGAPRSACTSARTFAFPSYVADVVCSPTEIVVLLSQWMIPDAEIDDWCHRWLQHAGEEAIGGERHTLRVVYGGEDTDMAAVVALTGLSYEAVIAQHADQTYEVMMVGFTPGFAYMGPLPAILQLPRKTTPRVSVPAGAVAIGHRYTGIYPRVGPGGWWILGYLVPEDTRELWRFARDNPGLFSPGDFVNFVSVMRA